jgi:hypothetical protein
MYFRTPNLSALFYCLVAQAMASLPSSSSACKRKALADAIADTTQQLRMVRRTFSSMADTLRRQRLAKTGVRHTMRLVILRLLSKYNSDWSLQIFVAIRLLPACTWLTINGEMVNRPEHLRKLLEMPKVQTTAEAVWSHRHFAGNIRTLKKVKRLVAEYRVFLEVVLKNRKGVTPKLEDMLTWMKLYWPRSGDATDNWLNTFSATPRSCKKWLRRFRRFWCVSFGKLPVRGEHTLEMQALKV